jgi:hypothetical protein
MVAVEAEAEVAHSVVTVVANSAVAVVAAIQVVVEVVAEEEWDMAEALMA